MTSHQFWVLCFLRPIFFDPYRFVETSDIHEGVIIFYKHRVIGIDKSLHDPYPEPAVIQW